MTIWNTTFFYMSFKSHNVLWVVWIPTSCPVISSLNASFGAELSNSVISTTKSWVLHAADWIGKFSCKFSLAFVTLIYWRQMNPITYQCCTMYVWISTTEVIPPISQFWYIYLDNCCCIYESYLVLPMLYTMFKRNGIFCTQKIFSWVLILCCIGKWYYCKLKILHLTTQMHHSRMLECKIQICDYQSSGWLIKACSTWNFL